MKVILLAKESYATQLAISILESYFDKTSLTVLKGVSKWQLGDIANANYDYILSFLSPLILPKEIICSAKKAAINFHPGSPNYPGTGCYNFALYEKAEKYGVTCHHMQPTVDSGDIIATSYFNISTFDSVETLKVKTYIQLLLVFQDVIEKISNEIPLPISDEKWTRKAFTSKNLRNLCYIDPLSMSADEIELRIRSVRYPMGNSKPYTIINGCEFIFESENRTPII